MSNHHTSLTLAYPRKRSHDGIELSLNPSKSSSKANSSVQPQFINITNITPLDRSTRTKVRVQVMRDYHRRRQIQQDGKQSGDNSHLRSEVKGQTHKFRLGLAQNLREWVPAKAKDQKQKRPSTKKGTPKAKRLGVRATSGPRISQGSPVDDFGTVTSPGTELAYRDNFLQTETRLDPQFWVERSDSVFDVAVLEQWLASLSLTLQSAALYNSPSSGLLDPFSSMSLLITPRTQLLLDHYFNVRLQPAWLMMPMRKGLFSLAVHDPALFHTFLSHYVAAYNSRFQIGDPAESVQHRTRAIQIINERLTNQDKVLSDGTIATVANMAVYESSNGSTASMIVHLNGLEEMVNMRGGLENGGFILQVQRLIGWTDLHCASALSSKPRFPTLKVPVTERPEISPVPPVSLTVTYQPQFIDDIDRLFHQIRELSETMHNLRRSPILPQEDIWYSDKIYYLQCSLFDIIHNPNTPNRSLDAASALAGLIYCTHCLRDIPLTFQVIANAVTSLEAIIEQLEHEQFQIEGGMLGVRHLWVLGLGGVAAEGKRERDWFVVKFKKRCVVMGLINWDSAKGILERLLWQDRLNEAGKRLWAETTVVTVLS